MRVFVVGSHDKRARERACEVNGLVRILVDEVERVVGSAKFIAQLRFVERIEDNNLVIWERCAMARGKRGILALRVDDDRAARVKHKVRNDERGALAGSAACNGHDMSVVVDADWFAVAVATKPKSACHEVMAGQMPVGRAA